MFELQPLYDPLLNEVLSLNAQEFNVTATSKTEKEGPQ